MHIVVVGLNIIAGFAVAVKIKCCHGNGNGNEFVGIGSLQ